MDDVHPRSDTPPGHDSVAIARPRKAGAWLVMGVLALIAGGAYVLIHRSKPKTDAAGGGDATKERVLPVLAAEATARDVPLYLEGLGSVVPIQTVQLHAQVEGKLERVSFTEGQMVKRGQVIAQIDARPMLSQLHQMQAALARDTATYKNAVVNVDRYKSLREQNLVPEQQLTDQQALVDQSSAAMQSDQAQVESAQLQVGYATLTSPIDGVTGVRQVDPGNLVHVNDATGIVVITQLDPIAVVFTLPEDSLGEVSKALAAGALEVDAFARDGVTAIARGKLALIDNQIDAATATIKLKALFANPERSLWPNQFVRARLLVSTRKGALTVPAAAVQRGPQGVFVYVVGADKKVSMHPVVVDRTQGDVAILRSGVEAGQLVVTDGQSQLRPGSSVLARTPNDAAKHAAPDPSAPKGPQP